MVNPQYDVFLSFRGEDTRNNFISHLYSALCRVQVRTFIDDSLVRGDDISQSLLNGIRGSAISIVVFSKRYASSRWCLEELLHILHCREEQGPIVIPVFYNVDPSAVRRQTGEFGNEFATLAERFMDDPELLMRWRDASMEVANLSGWVFSEDWPESQLIEKIVSNLIRELESRSLYNIESYVERSLSILSTAASDVFTFGIRALGAGIGLSLACTLQSRISGQYDTTCIIRNVGEQSEGSGGLTCMRQKILRATTLKDMSNPENGFTSTKDQSVGKKVLIILENVTNSSQVEFLIGGPRCFGPGSRIIEELSNKIIRYAEGVPLVIKILGSFLSGKRPQDWETILSKLEKTPQMDIKKVVKICYDGLNDEEKRVFLDIACSLNGQNYDLALETLKAGHLSAETTVKTLSDKSFIAITDNYKIKVDDILQEMGQDIQESLNNKIRSRL